MDVGTADNKILQVDQAAGLTVGNLVRATSSGLESRTDAEILAQLSGKASSAFDWNGQDLVDAGNIQVGDDKYVGINGDVRIEFDSTNHYLKVLGGDFFTDRWLFDVSNTAFGVKALGAGLLTHGSGSEGYSNTAIGNYALYANKTGFHNTSIGKSAFYLNSTGSRGTAVGYETLFKNTSGYGNTVVGALAFYNNTTGGYSSGVGYGTLFYNQEGQGNAVLGYEAGYGTTLHNKSHNVLIGHQAGKNLNAVDHKLVIANSYTDARTLIHGDFSTKTLFTKTPTSAPVDGDFHASDICFYLEFMVCFVKIKGYIRSMKITIHGCRCWCFGEKGFCGEITVD